MKKKNIKLLVVLACVLMALGMAGCGKKAYKTFPEKYKLASVDVGGMTADEAKKAIKTAVGKYKISVKLDDASFDMTAKDLGLKYNDKADLQELINAANKDKDFKWFSEHKQGDTSVLDLSEEYAQLALQGPRAKAILSKLADAEQLPEKYYTFRQDIEVAGISCLVSRTGYTGEDGYEVMLPGGEAPGLWARLLGAGARPAGLGARDTLRLEYERDVKRGLPIAVPENYFEDDDPAKGVVFRWRSHANLFFSNWLNYYVYQETPYDLEKL